MTEKTGKVIWLKQQTKEPYPEELEWARPLIDYQDTTEFKDFIRYEMALAKQERDQRNDARQ